MQRNYYTMSPGCSVGLEPELLDSDTTALPARNLSRVSCSHQHSCSFLELYILQNFQRKSNRWLQDRVDGAWNSVRIKPGVFLEHRNKNSEEYLSRERGKRQYKKVKVKLTRRMKGASRRVEKNGRYLCMCGEPNMQ